jgi:hypothetical protein
LDGHCSDCGVLTREASRVRSTRSQLAWPIAIVFLALLFREKLSTILDRMLEARLGKFTLKLRGADQLLKAAKQELRMTLPYSDCF